MELCNYSCADQTRYYDIEAIEIPIVYNKYGDYDPNGLLYVFKKRCPTYPRRRSM